jgi:molybdate/tungstate transport system substrate-binding protein
VHAEENLVDRLESGAIDVGFFYSTETADKKVASMTPPADIASSAHYSVTVLRDAPMRLERSRSLRSFWAHRGKP